MKVKITAEDIKRGGKGCHDCPIAKAMTKKVGTLVTVTSATVDWKARRGWRIERLTPSAKRFIHDYDLGLNVKPRTIQVF